MSAMFQFISGGIGVMPDPEDNPAGHVVPNHESGTRVSYEVANVGDAGGVVTVSIELDGSFTADVQSSFLVPGQREVGFIGLGRLSEGAHAVLLFLNPGAGELDHETNDFSVG